MIYSSVGVKRESENDYWQRYVVMLHISVMWCDVLCCLLKLSGNVFIEMFTKTFKHAQTSLSLHFLLLSFLLVFREDSYIGTTYIKAGLHTCVRDAQVF